MPQEEFVLPPALFHDLDRSGPLPLYFQVSQRIESAISDGSIPISSRLENEVSLAARLGISRPTIRRAIQELVDKGLLVRRRGIGTQVVHGHVTRGVELTSLFEDLESTSRRPATRVLELSRVADVEPEILKALGAEPGSELVFVRRERSADGVPVAILQNWLPASFGDLTAADLEAHGLYQLMRGRGVTIRVARQEIGARTATDDEAELLGIDRHSALLTMARTAYGDGGDAVEYGRHCYRPDLYSFAVTLVGK
jgi:DNA-binding GntR family transcriptional regulator